MSDTRDYQTQSINWLEVRNGIAYPLVEEILQSLLFVAAAWQNTFIPRFIIRQLSCGDATYSDSATDAMPLLGDEDLL